MSTPTARHRCPYRPGAPSWYVRATRSALPASRFPAVKRQQLAAEQVAVSVGHSGEDGTAHVTLLSGRHLGKPPRPGAARDTWLRLRADIAAHLHKAGFATVPTKGGVRATPPRPEPVAVHLEHGDVFRDGLDALGRYRIWCPEHPHLAGRLQHAHGLGPQVFTYVYATQKARHPIWPTGFRTLHDAAEAWAAHMGLPPVTVTET
ncbi:hypothetical protein [Streptomyces sp. MBT33]|uniref:hypothetical protein n=1 Tax=Streptomyces sp. MBT33 TaxID=1488363 RepID=UPI00190C2378|nr:hypothetical protein [Streptomyces sp. MBT33]MBK3644131.1 hypothetical protein [Streptomyces sp. MBT33]